MSKCYLPSQLPFSFSRGLHTSTRRTTSVAAQFGLESTPLGRKRAQGLRAHLEKNDDDIVITAAGRTPFCKSFKGGLRDTPFDILSLETFKGILKRADIDPALIEDVVVGNVRNADGAYQIRGAAIAAGIPSDVPTMIVNRWCSSGLMAVRTIADQIASGEIGVGLAAGVESMTQHPPRQGFSQQLKDAHQDAADAIKPMGWTSEQVAAQFSDLVTRARMDEFAARSHSRATDALKSGRFGDEIFPVTARLLERCKNDAGKEELVPDGKESWSTVSQDDGIRQGSTAEGLGKLKPAFPDWAPALTTAGNASQVSDGGAAVLLMRRSVAKQLGKPILAKYVSTAVAGLQPRIMGIGPALAVPKLLKQTGVAKEEVDLFEINEAFASMGVYCQDKLGIPDDKFNVNGGAIALGHPLGATGTRLVATVLHELARRDQQVGVVSMMRAEVAAKKHAGASSLDSNTVLLEATKLAGTRESVDALARWIKAKLAEQKRPQKNGSGEVSAVELETQHTVASVISAGLDSNESPTQQRAQALLRSVFELNGTQSLEEQECHAIPSAVFRDAFLLPALARLEPKRSLLVLEVFVNCFGTRVLGPQEDAQRIIASLAEGLVNADGAPRRKSAVIVAIVRASFPKCHNSSYSNIDWTATLAKALRNSTEVARTHVREYVLPFLFDYDNSIFPLLCRCLLDGEPPADGMALLRGLLALFKPAKRRGLCRVDDRFQSEDEAMLGLDTSAHGALRPVIVIPSSLVQLCILSADDEVSTGALALLSESKTSSSPFGTVELRLLLQYFRSNISSTDSGMRSKVTAMITSVMTRLRLGTYASAKVVGKSSKKDSGGVTRTDEHQTFIDGAQEFLRSIFKICCQNLWPGAAYSSMLSSLHYLDLLLSSQLDPRFDSGGSGAGSLSKLDEESSEPNKALRKSMKTNPQTWPFELALIDAALVKTLFSCFSSTFEDVRKLARGLLLRCPAPLEGLSRDSDEELLRTARSLLLSARASQTGTGTALMQVYGHFYASVPLLQSLFAFAEEQVTFAEREGIAAAASQRPLHGCLWALQQVLEEDVRRWSSWEEADIEQTTLRTQILVGKVWILVMPILSSQMAAVETEDEGDEEAGVEQPDLELARAITLAGGEEGESGSDSNSTGPFKHQILLSYGWRSLKEASALLRLLVVSVLDSRSHVLTTDTARSIGTLFLEWMTKIRHRGAFSVIYPELSGVAASLLASGRKDLTYLPQEWLDRLTSDICSRDTTYSTTRRSAGLTFAVLALLQAFQAQTKGPAPAIRTTVLRLEEEADRLQADALTGDDGRQVHLFNILRVLVLDGRVGPQLVPLIGQLIRLAVSRFQADSWNLSNVAMLLFSATIKRAFASRQQQNKDDVGRKAPFDRFFAEHSGLADFLVDELLRLQSRQDERQHSGTASGALFALIAFISRLQAVTGDSDDAVRLRFRHALSQATHKHVLLRDIAARASASTATSEEALSLAAEALAGLKTDDASTVHTKLLRAQHLVILSLQAPHLHGKPIEILQALHQFWQQYQRDKPSADMLQAASIQLWRTVSSTFTSIDSASEAESIRLLRSICQARLDGFERSAHAALSPAASECLATCTQTLLDLEHEPRDAVARLLRHRNVFVRGAALDFLRQNHHLFNGNTASVMVSNLDAIATDKNLQFSERCAAMTILSEANTSTAHGERKATPPGVLEDLLWEAWDTPCVTLREHLMQYAAKLLLRLIDRKSLTAACQNALRLLTELLRLASEENESVNSRLAAIRSLRTLAPLLFDADFVASTSQSRSEQGSAAEDLFGLQVMAVRMVEDDDEDVRHEAARLLAESLPHEETPAGAGLSPALIVVQNSLLEYGGTPQSTKEAAWMWLHKIYTAPEAPQGISRRWCQYLWAHVLPEAHHIDTALQQAFEIRTALFAMDDPNLYRDKTFDLQLAARIIQLQPAIAKSLVSDDDRQRLVKTLLRFHEALRKLPQNSTLGDPALRYVLGLRLVLSAKIAARFIELDAAVQDSIEEISNSLALGYHIASF
ncbi:hypothetical protein OC842_003480 [Tilletia horrida]|uniref:DUF2428 domain-containing protein n=1 Tax=Tilletia horrida TaxID=155126 RepID=A0AAN6GDI1_9BASI|nr:hypothetical protein OC842_003480 [Tilletia horrida]